MKPVLEIVLARWHRVLGLPKQTPSSWYRQRIYEELKERRAAKTCCQKLSESSDVIFSISRARYDGVPVRMLPTFSLPRQFLPYMYMLAKYTSRWAFYRTTARVCGFPKHRLVREVVNPGKDSKLEEVAMRHQIDVALFLSVARRLRRGWPLLP